GGITRRGGGRKKRGDRPAPGGGVVGGNAGKKEKKQPPPQEPSKHPGELHAIDFGHRLAHAERGERALGRVGEGLERLARMAGDEVLRELPPFAHGELRGLWRIIEGLLPSIIYKRNTGPAPRGPRSLRPGTRMKRSTLIRPQTCRGRAC